MEGLRLKKRNHQAVSSRYVLIPLILVCILLIHATWKAYGKYVKSNELRKISEDELFDLKTRDLKLRKDIEELKTDFGKEALIRNKFGLVRNGEQLVVIVDEQKTNTNPILELTLWDKITMFFKGLF